MWWNRGLLIIRHFPWRGFLWGWKESIYIKKIPLGPLLLVLIIIIIIIIIIFCLIVCIETLVDHLHKNCFLDSVHKYHGYFSRYDCLLILLHFFMIYYLGEFLLKWWGGWMNFNFFNSSSSFCFLLIEFHLTFYISFKNTNKFCLLLLYFY